MDTVEIPIVALAVGGGITALLLLGLFVSFRSRRAHARRLGQALLRLEESPEISGRNRFDRLLTRLEDGIDRAILSRGDAASTAERLTQALDSVPQGVVVCDDTATITYRNTAASRLATGRHGDTVVDRAVGDLLTRALHGGPCQRTLEIYGPPRRVIEIAAVRLEAGWRTGGAVAVISDVSERHRVEAMRRDFVANISHELKTPVGALALLAETMAGEDDPDVARRLATRMQRESVRVDRIINDLLSLSSIEAEEAPSRDAVPITVILGEASDRVSALAARKNVVIDVDESDHEVMVVCDRRQLVSAVFNLLENAVKYSGNGSRIEVRATSQQGIAAISVRDEGIGIPSVDLERIFERFYRVDRGRSRDTGGTGLGLAIVRHVVANHSGEVRVESREGEGSVFTLRFPSGVPAEVPSREHDTSAA
ncbi:MAG TPA: ATP-binding protein [Acidimicrobiales bacterium]